jgi:putative transposase
MHFEPHREPYPTDLTDEQWALVKPFVQQNTGPERLPEATLREIMNAILWKAQSKCAWEYLPHDFPDWTIVRSYFEKWTRDRTWEQLYAALRDRVHE